MNTDQKTTLRVSRHFSASPEQVFDAWLDPKTASKWLFATPTGEIVRCDIDAKVGGKFTITRRDGEDIDHTGEYVEIDRPRRLVFTFAVQKFSAEETRVTIDITPSDNGCDLTLTHEGVLPDWKSKTEEGWTTILKQLAAALT